MKILSASVRNFGSYKQLDFTFDSKGLVLISGPTGSGKSTLCDIVPWVLFGRSSKGGAVDEVISWNATATNGSAELMLSDGTQLEVYRSRAPNDLYCRINSRNDLVRGKDLTDTQKLINDLLGMDSDTYLASSYYHEFSTTAQFFSTTAKNRRSITEQLVDLSLASSLQESTSAFIKDLKKDRQELLQSLGLKKHTLSHLKNTLQEQDAKAGAWTREFTGRLVVLETKAFSFLSEKEDTISKLYNAVTTFEVDRTRRSEAILHEIKECESAVVPPSVLEERQKMLNERKEALPATVCAACGNRNDNHLELILIKDQYALDTDIRAQEGLKREIITLEAKLSSLERQVNPYTERLDNEVNKPNLYLEQLSALESEINPYSDTLKLVLDIDNTTEDITNIQEEIDSINVNMADTELLNDVVNEFRGTLIQNTIDRLQHTTNDLLSRHFDAELRVGFSANTADKIDVDITKDGNKCSYTQLSKGQRQILKLCFSVSVMRAVSNYSGASSNCLFLDESLDGLSEEMKSKAYTLLEELALEYSSVFCVEHSEGFKSLFNNKINVSLVNGRSVINEEI